MHERLDQCDALEANGCSDDDVRDDKVEEEVFWVLNKRGTLVAAGKSFSKEVEEAFIAYMDGIYDDREVVAERRKKIWRMKS